MAVKYQTCQLFQNRVQNIVAVHEKHDVKILSFIFHKWYISSNNFDVNLELSLDWTFFFNTH